MRRQRGTRHGTTPRTVVVTGASAGIGRATARLLAARGDRLALLARGDAGLEATADEVRAFGVPALPLSVDMADDVAVEEAADRVERELGPIDVWVNDGFTSVFAEFMDIEPAEFRRTTEVTYLGYVNGTRAALRRMLPRDSGTVVQVGSAIAYRGIPLQSAYSGAKHAIQGFNEALRCELLHGGTRVRTTMVQMPAVNTPQFGWVANRLRKPAQPVPPIYQPRVAARAVAWASEHPGRREYWVGGSTCGTLLANAVVPGLLDRYLARTGYASQQAEGHPEPERRHGNLWRPDDECHGTDHGAHGDFDERAKEHSAQLWAAQHHGLLAATLTGAGTAAGVAARQLTRHR